MTRCCESCAGKLERPTDDRKSAGPYIVTQEGGRIWGMCPLCFRMTETYSYEITPRRIRYARAKTGGGERERAGR